MKWHVGCSGFSYKEWKDVFYPSRLPQRLWFNHYNSRFSTLELNVTFYRFPQLKMLQGWYDKSPAGFLFSVKAPRLITHFKQLKDCKDLLNNFYSVCRDGLKEKLGALLFQFPPKFIYTEERLHLILDELDNSFINVVEFRHSSWWDPKIFKALGKKKIVFCGSSFPGLPDQPVHNTDTLYYRFHGIPKLFYSEYTPGELKKVAKSVLKEKDLEQVFCYFNNTAAVGAIENALWMEAFVAKHPNPAL